MFFFTEYESPIGKLTVSCDGMNLCGLWLDGQKYFLDTLPEQPLRCDEIEVFHRVKDWLDRYFAGNKPEIHDLPLKPIGGGFRQAVWDCLCEIPYGEVTTYGAIAQKIASTFYRSSMSAQAVGGAVGRNPISIIIPCHRVIGKNGNLTGYAGGIDKKVRLLSYEGVDIAKFFNPTTIRKDSLPIV